MLVAHLIRQLRKAGVLPLFAKRLSIAAPIAIALAVGFVSSAGGALAQNSQLQTIVLYAGMHRLTAELAIKPAHRAKGLMGRKSLAEHRGMLFVFGRADTHCFWMENTFVPLSIAFLRDDGSIVNVRDMEPLKRDQHCAAEPVRLALEVNQGWFDERNLGPDMVIRGLPKLP